MYFYGKKWWSLFMPIDVLSNIQEKMASNDKFVFIHKGGGWGRKVSAV